MLTVLLTVNPGLLEGKRYSTVRSMVTHLHSRTNLLIVPCDGFDFKRKRVRAFTRSAGGTFSFSKEIRPQGDLWINYSDGYYLDHKKLGFKRHKSYFDAQMEFYETALEKSWVDRVINRPAAEKRTLKSWFAGLDSGKLGIAHTELLDSWADVSEFRKDGKKIVCKPDWGGAGFGAVLLQSDQDVLNLRRTFAGETTELSDVVFQEYCQGDEKRFWFLKGKFVEGRAIKDKENPWNKGTVIQKVRRYNSPNNSSFQNDLRFAQKVCALSGIEIGSVDFIGDKINEVNGCGTIFTAYEGWEKKVDARPQLLDYLDQLLASYSAAQ